MPALPTIASCVAAWFNPLTLDVHMLNALLGISHLLVAACRSAPRLLSLTLMLGITPALAQVAPTLINPTLPLATRGVAYSTTIGLGGSTAPTSVIASGLPPGIAASHTGNGNVTFSGVPIEAGAFNVTLAATNISGSATLALTLHVNAYALTTDVSGGTSHTCAVVDGGVQCWGSTTQGQLGNKLFSLAIPVPAEALPRGSGATQVTAGDQFSCAVVNGGLQCWGLNSSGQLGDGSTTRRTAPVAILPAGSGVTRVEAGVAFACAVVSGGVKCWGTNAQGQLGNGSTTASTAPVDVSGLGAGSGVTGLTVGAAHACALVSGQVRCWGANNFLQVTNASATTQAITPITRSDLTGTPTALGSGAFHTCVVTSGGVSCWGDNFYKQLGATPGSNGIANAIASGAGATQVTGGDGHTCALVGGEVRCWGSNALGQLGIENQHEAVVPTVASFVPSGVTQIEAGLDHTCAIVANSARCWGSNAQLALGVRLNRIASTPRQTLAHGTQASAVATGSSAHTCAIVQGGVQCWGLNSNKQLGVGDGFDRQRPVQTIASGQNVSAIAVGDRHTCALVAGGVLCWGKNGKGQIGVGGTSTADVSLPTPVLVGTVPMTGATAISAGLEFSCAVVNGGVRCWGTNGFGQLGVTSPSNQRTAVTTLPDASGATAVATGDYFACALISGGVQCWGRGDQGQLGNGAATGGSTPVQAIAAGSGVTAIMAGSAHACAVINGGLSCWGNNNGGQIGNGSTTQQNAPFAVFPAGSGVSSSGGGVQFTCAVVNNGVRCWGDGSVGELGVGAPVISNAPVTTIADGSGVTTIGAGGVHACVVITGGVHCWGRDDNGSIGHPSVAPVQPVAVPTFRVSLDIDGDAPTGSAAGTSDAVLIYRFLKAIASPPATANALSNTATRRDAVSLHVLLASMHQHFDADGNGAVQIGIDGTIVVRFLLGFRGAALTAGLATATPAATRNANDITAYLASLMPAP